MVGDQIFTDVMGGNFARTQTILVEPFHEEKNLFFKIKRAAENIVFRRGEDLSGKKESKESGAKKSVFLSYKRKWSKEKEPKRNFFSYVVY